MNAGTRIALTVVTQFHHTADEANKLAATIQEQLGNWQLNNCTKYHKFDDAYKLEFNCNVDNNEHDYINHWSVLTSQLLVSPWLVYVDEDSKLVELIYNDAPSTQKRLEIFSQIRWAHWQIID